MDATIFRDQPMGSIKKNRMKNFIVCGIISICIGCIPWASRQRLQSSILTQSRKCLSTTICIIVLLDILF
ncbi:hypothetical protein ADJ79_02905 [Ottowia sp. oral taxon 894]|nr:hypothetical protein ADJ79_02905 [Ottowia sp. oral taxon 894]